jgi:hypothetical protein
MSNVIPFPGADVPRVPSMPELYALLIEKSFEALRNPETDPEMRANYRRLLLGHASRVKEALQEC